MKKKEFFEMELGMHKFPIQIVQEPRANGRVALASKEIIIRIPGALPYEEKNRIYQWAKDYIKHLFETKPEAFEKYIPVDYGKRSVISTFRDEIELELNPQPNSDEFLAELKDNFLKISMPQNCPTDDPIIGDVVANILKKKYLPILDLRVRELNEKHLGVPLGKVKMRNSSTRWGSCSSGRNISISTRAILAPEAVLDYILVHELCHLREMNHSAAYWKLVSSIDPTYKEKEVWLKAQGEKLKF